MLNISKGDMYTFVTHTWNTVKGKCYHDCSYCYMKRFPLNEIRFDEKELKTDLGKSNFIFIGSSCDMWADSVNKDWILRTLDHCKKYDKNTYLFQSKNPKRFLDFIKHFPNSVVLGTTIETNRRYKQMGNTPDFLDRAFELNKFKNLGIETMVTIEPIMDFDIDALVNAITLCNPSWINIGADSKGSNLPEPDSLKIRKLINVLDKHFTLKLKKNLKRLMGE